eukprot:3142748-Alexandrium_andersonii.AAC.1
MHVGAALVVLAQVALVRPACPLVVDLSGEGRGPGPIVLKPHWELVAVAELVGARNVVVDQA